MFTFKKFSNSFYLFIILILSGCSFFNEPVRDFFLEYTENVAVVRHNYPESVVKDKYGIDCLSSDEDKEILLYLRNPRSYSLNLDIVTDYVDPVTGGAIISAPTTYSVVQEADKSVLKIILRKDFLHDLECGGVFSPTVYLKESATLREFDSYHFDVKVNSIPVAPENAVVLVTASNPKKYVLCFNMPEPSLVKDIHKDIKILTVESNGSVARRKIYLTPDGDGKISYADKYGNSFAEIKTSVSAGEITENTDYGAAGLGFAARNNPVYIFTGDDLVPITNNIFYSITLEDEGGLATTTSTSVYSQKLNPPTATAVQYSDGETVDLEGNNLKRIVQNTDGAGYVKIILPAKTTTGLSVPSSIVDYEIYGGASFTDLLGSGSVGSSREIPVPPVECKIKAYARNSSYVSSDYAWFYVKPVCTKLYVSSSGSAVGWGTRNKPYNKISTALSLDLFADKTTPENTIVLLSDISDEGISINSKMNFTVCGQNSSGAASMHTITPLSATSKFMDIGASSEINIENLRIKNFNSSSSGSAFSVGSAMLTLNNVELSGNSSSGNGGALYLSDVESRVTVMGRSVIHGNTASIGGGAYVGNKDAVLAVRDNSYFALADEIYLCSGAMLYAGSQCTAQKIACIHPAVYPDDPVLTTVKLLDSSDMNPLDGTFCNTRVNVAKNPVKPELDYYIIYSGNLRCGILATGTSANVQTPVPDKVIFRQLYIKGIPLTFYATDGSGNKINPQDSSIKIKLRNDVLASGSKNSGYATVQIPSEYESQIENGKIGIDKVSVELSIKVSGIVYSATEDLVATTDIKDATTFAIATDLINTLEDSSSIKLELSGDFEVDDSTPLLGCDEAHKFNGTIDGKGHKITIKKTISSGDTRRTAVADWVGPKGVIKNVVVGGNYDYNPSVVKSIALAAIAVENEGLIINCVNYLNCSVNSFTNVGGIVVNNRKGGRIVNCANFGNITNKNTIYWQMICGLMGGIAGVNSGTIENCFNYGTVKSTVNRDVLYCANALPGAIVGLQNWQDNSAGSGNHCYWKDGCVAKNCSSEGDAYNSYAFKNSVVSFFWTYGTKGSNAAIDKSNKYNKTSVSSCGTFASASSNIVAGTAENTEDPQTLGYNGTLISVMNQYVGGKSGKYTFNGSDIDLLEWETDASHENYPKLKF